MRKILTIGSSGLVGSRWLELSKYKDNFLTPDYIELDILSPENIQKYFQTNGTPDWVINFAAFTDVGKAEDERGRKDGFCWKLNVEGLENLMNVFEPARTRFIQISTDMVFSGFVADKGPYDENHPPEKDSDKLTWYGYTKLLGEQKVQEKFKTHAAVLRLIYPVRTKYDLKLDYLRKPLKLFDEGKLYPLFADQQVSIAFVDEISNALDKIITQNATGTFHASSSDNATPFELVSYLLEKTRGVTGVVQKTSLDEFLKTVEAPVRYPKFGGLKVELTEQRLGIKFSSWKEIIDKLVDQGLGKD
jgi:dTDP-4-dehydrorhamnose reductase